MGDLYLGIHLPGKILLRANVAFNLPAVAAAKGAEPGCFSCDYIRSTLVKVADWQLQHRKGRDLRGASTGDFHAGVFAACEATENPGQRQAVVRMGEANQWEPGPRLMFPDHHIILNPHLDLCRLRPEPLTLGRMGVPRQNKSSEGIARNRVAAEAIPSQSNHETQTSHRHSHSDTGSIGPRRPNPCPG